MNSHHNNSTTIPTPIPNGMNYIVDPNRGETLIELSLPFLGEETDLGNVALANKHIRDCHWYYLYVCISQKYPTFQLEGLRPLEEQREKADMCLPPCIVVDPNFAPETFQPGNNTFPVPLPRQPKILYDPRCIGAFESWSWMDKTKALKEYAANVKTWCSSLTKHRAEELQASANFVVAFLEEQLETFRVDPSCFRNWFCLKARSRHLLNDLEKYPFFLQCLNEHEVTLVKLCFFEKFINEAISFESNSIHSCLLVNCLTALGVPSTSSHVRPFLARKAGCTRLH